MNQIISGSKIFRSLDLNKFWVKNTFDYKSFESRTIFAQNHFLVKKTFSPKEHWIQKNFVLG